jgi:hypothetical protein
MQFQKNEEESEEKLKGEEKNEAKIMMRRRNARREPHSNLINNRQVS